MKISNVEMAELMARRGVNYDYALSALNEWRDADKEPLDIPNEDLVDVISNITYSFLFGE